MARPAEINLKDVIKACEQISSLNQRPTVDRVRALLKKGSRTTINKFLREYLKQQEEEKKGVPANLPPAILLKLEEILNLSNSEHIQAIQGLEAAVQEKNAHIQEILLEGEELEKDNRVLKVERDALVAKHKELETAIGNLRDENASLKKEAQSLQTFKEKYISEKSRNDAIAEQMRDYKGKIKDLEKENRALLERALKAENKK